jgi:cell division septum initiation protein DivIVA
VVQVDTESEQSAVTSSPFFQVVRRGYDCTQVDAYIPELVARMAAAEQARAELQREIARLREQPTPTFEQLGEEAATVLQEAGRSAEQEVEQERAVLYAETAGVREYRDGLLEHLGRVHADISTLLERPLKHNAQEAPAAEGTAEPKAHPSPRPPASRP